MKISLIVIAITAVLFGVGGLVGGYFIWGHEDQKKISEGVKTEQKSGEKITQEDWKFKGKTIQFKTEAEGKGTATTTINKELIPEYRRWNKSVDIILLEYQGLLYENTFHHWFCVDYLHRWDWFLLGAGITGNYDKDLFKIGRKDYYGVGVKVFAGAMF